MSPKKSPVEKNEGNKIAIITAVIGLIGTVITAYFGFLSNTKPATANQTSIQNAPVVFLPIPDKELLVKEFKLNGSGERVNLKFIAKNFDLNFDFSAPLDMKCYSFLDSFLDHFEFREHIHVDTTNFPTGYANEVWFPQWILLVNSKKIDDCDDQTLREMALVDNDLIGIKIEWSFLIAISEPDLSGETQKQPPDVYP